MTTEEREHWLHLLRGLTADLQRLPRASEHLDDKELLVELDLAIDDLSDRVTGWYEQLSAIHDL